MTTSSASAVFPSSINASNHPLVIVDSGVEHHQSLVEGIAPEAEIWVISPERDGVEQITAALQGRHALTQSLHLISHGAPGAIFLGDSVLSLATLPRYAAQLNQWREFLAKDADLVIYGCRVAADPVGARAIASAPQSTALLQQIHDLTGANIYASSTPTGNTDRGGDWNFDYRLGDRTHPPAQLVLSPTTQRRWPGLLNVPPSFLLLGTLGPVGEDLEIEITFNDLQTQGDASDADGTIASFIVQTVTSSGTLRIGADAVSATPWEPVTNAVIDATNSAYWTPSTNVNGGSVSAFTVIALDNQGATSDTPVMATVAVTPINDDPFIGDRPFALYDTASATTPTNDATVPNGPALSFANINLLAGTPGSGNATETFAGSVTQLDTTGADATSDNLTYAGYSNYDTTDNLLNVGTFPALDRNAGYLISFDLKINEAVDSAPGSDKNLDGLPDRAGFSVIAISSDGQRGIELGFGTDSIWALDDGTGQLDPSLEPDPTDPTTSDRTLFTQAENASFMTNNSLVNYDLLVQGGAYNLYADGVSILSGPLRDYTAFTGLLDPYDNPNFLFFGDNTPSARGRVDIGDISVVNPADNTSYTSTFDEATDGGLGETDGVPVVDLLTLADIDGDAINSAVVTLTNPQGDLSEQLMASGTVPNVSFTQDSVNQVTVTNTGSATTDEMAAAIAAIRYQNDDDNPTEGDREVTLDINDGTGSNQITSNIAVVAATADAPSILINEIDADTPGSDTAESAEFIELFDGGVGNTLLDGFVIVFLNGNGDIVYEAFDLDGFSTDANGFFVLGNPDVANVDLILNPAILQNGTDAVALYAGDAANFPDNAPVTTANLIDAVVYGSSTDSGLLPLLNGGQSQVNENANGQSATQSLQRFPNGSGELRETASFIAGVPSPGLANAPTIAFASSSFTVSEDVGTSNVVELVRSSSFGQSTVLVSASGGSASTDDYDNTVFPITVTFLDGETSQFVSIPISEDATVEGEEAIALTLSDPTNAFIGTQATANLTITDNDTAGFALVESDGSTTVDETGTTDTFTVALTAQPLTDVTLTVVSGDAEEAIAEPTTLTFTTANWNEPQTVTVTGVDDVILDGPQTSAIAIAVDAATSDDAFDSLASQAVTVTTTDDDTAGFSILESDGNTAVDESGATDTFTVVLDRQPLANVQLAVVSADTDEAVVNTSTLIFTPENWNQPQTVTVTGVDDVLADGLQTTAIAVSVDTANSDAAFSNVAPQTVSVTTADNDTAGVSVTPTDGNPAAIEGGTDTYAVVLDSQPESEVVITLTSDDQVSVDTTTVTFTPSNWNVAQTVTVTAIDDNLVEGAHTGTISHSATSSDPNYAGITVPDVTVDITDNDTAAIAITQTDDTTAVAEGGATDTYAVVLTATPTADVVVDLQSANGETSLSTPSVTFTPATWNVPQTVTITAIDDTLVEGNHTDTIVHTASSNDPNFNNVTVADVAVAIADNDLPGFAIVESDGITSVDESGTEDTFAVTLDSQPVNDVVLTVVESDAGEAIALPTTLTFTNSNWNVAQTVTVTGQDDTVVDGTAVSTLTVRVDAAASDPAFANVAAEEVQVLTVDDDTAGFTVADTDGTTIVDEAGSTDTFTVVLDQQPLTPVALTVTSGDLTEATVTPTTLTFTPDDWNTPQAVTVKGVDDNAVDGSQQSLITVSVNAANSDNAFDALTPEVITVTTEDDDMAGATITQSNGNTAVIEGGTTDSYTVKLDAQPTDTVTIALSPDNQLTLNKSTLTFTPQNWNQNQTVTVTALNDEVVEGPHTGTIIHDVSSNDLAFDNLAIAPITVDITDNDSIGFTINESNGLTEVSEAGETDGYTLFLNSQPTANVTITLTPDEEVTLNQSTLTFTPQNWNQAQTVIVTAVNDKIAEGLHTATISHSVSSSDPEYNGAAIADITATITDNDTAGIVINQSNNTTLVAEGGATDGYSVVLSSQPTDTVTIGILTDEQTTVSKNSLTFTPQNWNIAQNVTVAVIDDPTVEGNHFSTISHVVTSSDSQYDGLAIADIATTITDNDFAGFKLSQTAVTVSEEGTLTETVLFTLTGEPLSPVILKIANPDPTEVSLDQTTVTLDSSNWDTGVEVQIQSLNDNLVDGDQTTSLTVSVVDASSADAFDVLPNQTLTVTSLDNNVAELVLSTTTVTVSEAGETASYTVSLTSIPTAEVLVTFDGGDQLETPEPLIFTAENWNLPQTVTIAAIDDDTFDPDQTGLLTSTVSSNDPNFNAIEAPPIAVEIVENDTAEVILSTATAIVSEAGTTETYTVALSSRPTADVTVTFDGGDELESPDPITFTAENWDVAQTVTIAAIDDLVFEGPHAGTLTPSVSSDDPDFDAIEVAPIAVEIGDNDILGFVLSTTTATVSEAGATDSYTVALTSQPTAAVVLSFNGGEELQTPAPITFTPENWNVAQTVTVAAIDDNDFEDAHTGTLTQTFSSNDANYDGLAIAPITAAIADNDRPTDLIFTFDQFVTFQALDEGIAPSFDEELYLLANPDVAAAVQRGEVASGAQHFELFGRAEGRPVLPLNLEIGGLRMADFYDETYYLNQNQDVAVAVQQGAFANGYEHFLRFGIAEGRNPSRYYNESFYLAANQDVAAAVRTGDFRSGLAHYLQFGHFENREASVIFDPEDYLLDNPDVRAAVEAGTVLSAFEHFLEAGAQESRLPILLFEEFTYLRRNPDVARAVARGELPSGYNHYVSFGQAEGRDPSVIFDESAYLAVNPDVATAVNNEVFSSGMEHYFRFGRAEDRPLL